MWYLILYQQLYQRSLNNPKFNNFWPFISTTSDKISEGYSALQAKLNLMGRPIRRWRIFVPFDVSLAGKVSVCCGDESNDPTVGVRSIKLSKNSTHEYQKDEDEWLNLVPRRLQFQSILIFSRMGSLCYHYFVKISKIGNYLHNHDVQKNVKNIKNSIKNTSNFNKMRQNRRGFRYFCIFLRLIWMIFIFWLKN